MKHATHHHLLAAFQSAVLSGKTEEALPLIKDKPGFPRQVQMAIYIDGYRLRLEKAVAADFPTLHHLLGDAEFSALVRGYVASTPSHYFNLDKYPYEFPQYVGHHHGDAFARELALLEGAIVEVYAMEESPPATPSLLSELTPEALAEMHFPPRTAHRLLAFDYPANAYLTAFREGKRPAAPARSPSFLAVWRHRHNVRRREMDPLEFQLFSLLAEAKTVDEALDALEIPESLAPERFLADLQRWFAEWIAEGMIRASGCGNRRASRTTQRKEHR